MIPNDNNDLQSDFEIEEQPTKTYEIDLNKNRVAGNVDGLAAVKQTVFLILNTERYEHIIYSWNYGIELHDLYGEPTSYVIPELKRRIYEALTQDERILGVDAFSFDVKKKSIHLTFTVNTIYGDFESERTVKI
ncbi:DUF2634 domain-containing protein [Peribacillus loiseleuriae]|uniref:Phage portal protein n=1 Tax=Peribacillus loiseleuriae TaxID=1679170 RepID=A0A0K9GRL2_9BACI|nr:DUF2634 domain-containing protein [Peribacillus loiseleuriae]KMY49241.1 hypothetical protein AC625_06660 [Peribacillus loiseleuriae]